MDKNVIIQINVTIRKSREKLLKENMGSDKGKLVPTDKIVTDFLVKNFGRLDYNSTAKVEQDFDEIAEGNLVFKRSCKFY
jgi:DNA topoisomerase-1